MVPREWADMISALRQAQVAREGVRNKGASQQLRDESAVAYGRALDQVFAALDVLMETQVLGRVTLFLAKKERG